MLAQLWMLYNVITVISYSWPRQQKCKRWGTNLANPLRFWTCSFPGEAEWLLKNPLKSMEFPGSLNRWQVPYNHPIGNIYHLYTTYLLPIGWLYGTYHLLWEPGNSIDKTGVWLSLGWRGWIQLQLDVPWSGRKNTPLAKKNTPDFHLLKIFGQWNFLE